MTSQENRDRATRIANSPAPELVDVHWLCSMLHAAWNENERRREALEEYAQEPSVDWVYDGTDEVAMDRPCDPRTARAALRGE